LRNAIHHRELSVVGGVLYLAIGQESHTRKGVIAVARPTKRAIKRKPYAAIFFSWEKGTTDKPATDRDFEWFEDKTNCEKYTEQTVQWSLDDFKEHGDLAFLIAEVVDTKADPIVLSRVLIVPADSVDLIDWKQQVESNPNMLLDEDIPIQSSGGIAVKAPRKKAAKVSQKKATPPVKATEAKKANAPKPRANNGAGKKAAPAISTAKKVQPASKGAAPKPRAGGQALKNRLAKKEAAKQAVAAPEKAAASKPEAPEAPPTALATAAPGVITTPATGKGARAAKAFGFVPTGQTVTLRNPVKTRAGNVIASPGTYAILQDETEGKVRVVTIWSPDYYGSPDGLHASVTIRKTDVIK